MCTATARSKAASYRDFAEEPRVIAAVDERRAMEDDSFEIGNGGARRFSKPCMRG
jgi:hypothetical protein